MTMRCECCEIREATTLCSRCGRTVCSQCIGSRPLSRVHGEPVCYCGVSCAQTERDWETKCRQKAPN